MLFLFLSLLIGISLWSHNINDPTLNQSISSTYEIKNYAGTFGAYLSGFLNDFFGIASYIWVLFFFGMGLGFIVRWVIIPWYSMLGYAILALCFITFAEAVTLGIGDVQGGGFCGAWLYATFHLYFNPIGSAFIWLFCLMVGMELCFHISWVTVFGKILRLVLRKKDSGQNGQDKQENSTDLFRSALHDDEDGQSGQDKKEKKNKKFQNSFKIQFKNPFKKDKQDASLPDPDGGGAEEEKENGSADHSPLSLWLDDDEEDSENSGKNSDAPKDGQPDPDGEDEADEPSGEEHKHGSDGAKSESEEDQSDNKSEKTEKPKKEKKKGFFSNFFGSDPLSSDTEYKEPQTSELPSLDLLSPVIEPKDAPSKADLEEKGRKLIECLADFSVQGKLAGILPGPVVTMYEVRPERGVKVKRFEALEKDIAMAIKAIAVRIQAPIPGTDTVGVEVPNDRRQLVCFKEIIQHRSFAESKSKLTLGLGKDIFGNPVSVKMDDMPHLLVAGATGAGKSVCLNSIILSILYKAQPHEVQMLLIDPKRVELSMYNGLPHLVHPVVTDMDLARNALLWAVDEMDQRYKLFENLGMRNITEYNAFVRKNREALKNGTAETLPERLQAMEAQKLRELPFIVIIVDELADLMMQKGKEVEGHIARLGQLARAAGMHIILATQRPSVDVITGLIKNNFPARIAFQVSSSFDSRTILDSVGAEVLLGKGDMLFKPRSGGIMRIHGAYVTEEEVRRVTEFWKEQAAPDYKVDFGKYGETALEPAFSDDGGDEHDEMYDTITEWLQDQDSVSISMLQRRFRLGFSRAGRIIDKLEADGYIEARSGSKPRKVIH